MNKRVAFASTILLVALCGCGGNSGSGSSSGSAPTQQEAQSLAGIWTITCTQQAPDCADISVTVDQAGALLDAEVPGFSGLIQGGAEIDMDNDGNQVLRINILDAYTFEGTVSYMGGSALGNLTIADIENGQEVVSAYATLMPQ